MSRKCVNILPITRKTSLVLIRQTRLRNYRRGKNTRYLTNFSTVSLKICKHFVSSNKTSKNTTLIYNVIFMIILSSLLTKWPRGNFRSVITYLSSFMSTYNIIVFPSHLTFLKFLIKPYFWKETPVSWNICLLIYIKWNLEVIFYFCSKSILYLKTWEAF